MKVTMEKIAELAGVSLSTVSRSLNDSPEISQKTKARIRDICAKYGYNVNAAASSLRRQSPGSLGLVIPFAGAVEGDFNSPFILEMVGKITSISAEHGYDVIVSLSHQLGRLSKQKLYAAGKVDALIIIGQGHEHESLNRLHEEGVPFVVWGDMLERQLYPTIGGPNLEKQLYATIGGDNLEGGRLATQHLLDTGRKNILFIGEFRLPEVHLRYHGHCRALNEAGLSNSQDGVFDITFSSVSDARRKIAELLSDRPGVDAICAASDFLGVAAIHALAEFGLNVPRDVAVTGYDDIYLADLSSPTLTSVHQDLDIGSQKLVEAAMALGRGEPAANFTVPTYLVERKSSAIL